MIFFSKPNAVNLVVGQLAGIKLSALITVRMANGAPFRSLIILLPPKEKSGHWIPVKKHIKTLEEGF